jgi:kumamolisin
MTERFALPGSHRTLHPAARAIGVPDPSDHAEVAVVLRRRAAIEPRSLHAAPLDRHTFARTHGAASDDVSAVDAFAREFNLSVGAVDLARRMVTLHGTLGALGEAFGTRFRNYQTEQGVYRGRAGDLYLPLPLADIVHAVLGLDNRPQARPRIRRTPHASSPHGAARQHAFTPVELAALYGLPPGTGRGQTIALIELGGGYVPSDLQAYFRELGIALPAITSVSVDRARNWPTGDPGGADGEVLLDIEVAGAIAPDAHIVVYFAPNTDRGFLDAITTAVHDDVRRPTVISISWGAAEPAWTRQALRVYDEAFQDAAALGVTICCASGDNGADDGVDDGRRHVDFPASSPHALACGGTRLDAADGRILRESVWNAMPGGGATGGGVSEVFPRPDYQEQAHVPASVNAPHFRGRGVPDVAGNADPATGYRVRVDGHTLVVGGTSAVSPLWAALIARRNELAGRPLGYANPAFYSAAAARAFRDITSGENGAYQAAAGWDPCTGLGSPRSAEFWLHDGVTG